MCIFPDVEYNGAIRNYKKEGLVNISSKLSWIEMYKINYQISTKNIGRGQFIANVNKESIGIRENIYRLTGSSSG